MKNRVAFIVFWLLVICCYSKAEGADWKLYAENEFYSYYYDAESISSSDKNIFRVSIKLVGNSSDIINYLEIDCENKKSHTIAHTIYDREGKVLHAKSFDITVWESIASDTIGELLYKAVCPQILH